MHGLNQLAGIDTQIKQALITSFAQKSTFGVNIDREMINICKLLSIISKGFRPPDGPRKLPVLWDTSMDPYDHFQST